MIENPWECPQCHSWVNGNESHLCIFPKETFPRPPSNEAQLFAELGRMMAARDEARRQLAEVAGWKQIAEEQLTRAVAERNALAVANSELRNLCLKLEIARDERDSLLADHQQIGQALGCGHIEDGLARCVRDLAVTAERQTEQIRRLRESLAECAEMVADYYGQRDKVAEKARTILKETAP